MLKHIEIFQCPACRGDIRVEGNEIRCAGADHRFGIEDGIPKMFLPNDWDGTKVDVTEKIKSFYEQTPFPNYEDMESVGDLVTKAREGVFAQLLNEQIPFRTRVLEAGCGTGQLVNFLSVACRSLFGTDICMNSLRLGEEFRRRSDLRRAGFYQMNLFRPIFKDESFHLVICNGVLHHTSDPLLGFCTIARLVKRGGYVIVGLYNRYGRLLTDLRRVFFGLFGDRFLGLDPRLKRSDLGPARRQAWFRDQYKNPHESKHTIGQVMKWFAKSDFAFVSSIPGPALFDPFSEKTKLFTPSGRGNPVSRLLVQLKLIKTGNREGGLFVMIGKRL